MLPDGAHRPHLRHSRLSGCELRGVFHDLKSLPVYPPQYLDNADKTEVPQRKIGQRFPSIDSNTTRVRPEAIAEDASITPLCRSGKEKSPGRHSIHIAVRVIGRGRHGANLTRRIVAQQMQHWQQVRRCIGAVRIDHRYQRSLRRSHTASSMLPQFLGSPDAVPEWCRHVLRPTFQSSSTYHPCCRRPQKRNSIDGSMRPRVLRDVEKGLAMRPSHCNREPQHQVLAQSTTIGTATTQTASTRPPMESPLSSSYVGRALLPVLFVTLLFLRRAPIWTGKSARPTTTTAAVLVPRPAPRRPLRRPPRQPRRQPRLL